MRFPRAASLVLASLCLFGVACGRSGSRCGDGGPAAASSVDAITYDLPRAGDGFGPPPAMPNASGANVAPVAMVFVVDIDKGGVMTVNGAHIDKNEDVTRLARDARSKTNALRAVIRADRETPWAAVIRALDLVKTGGISQVAFGVDALGPQP